MSEQPKKKSETATLLWKGCVLVGGALLTAFLAHNAGFTTQQVLSAAVFMGIVLSTLLFWEFRLAIAFIGIAALLGCRVLTLQSFIESSELDVILFLVGMMVCVGVMKELGLFTWIIQSVLTMKHMTGRTFVIAISVLSALLACVVDEVTSIIFLCALIFQVCDTLKIRATPFMIISVMATNIGSTGTMLGNPVGILVGYKAGFTFGDFMIWSFPIMLICLAVTLGLSLYWFRRPIHELTLQLQSRRDQQLGLGPLVEVPYRRSLAILFSMIVLIASHHSIERMLGLEKNTVLMVAPLLVAGILMIWRHQRARHYVEEEVEWWTLLFFMMLFAVAGTLEHTGVTTQIAADVSKALGKNPVVLIPAILLITAIGSAFVDNVVFVAAFLPVVKELGHPALWWALLFGACLGGNITMIGSTANIVAIGMLEKRYKTHVRFGEWLKFGLVVGVVTSAIAWLALTILSPHMPHKAEPPEAYPPAAIMEPE